MSQVHGFGGQPRFLDVAYVVRERGQQRPIAEGRVEVEAQESLRHLQERAIDVLLRNGTSGTRRNIEQLGENFRENRRVEEVYAHCRDQSGRASNVRLPENIWHMTVAEARQRYPGLFQISVVVAS